MAYSVAIIVDRQFGDRLLELAERVHVWVCASPENRRLAERYRRMAPGASLERGITTFDVADSDPPDEMLIDVLATVDLHHGEYSHTPPWDTLEVYGTLATSAIRDALVEFGVSDFIDTPDGFRCCRPTERAASPRMRIFFNADDSDPMLLDTRAGLRALYLDVVGFLTSSDSAADFPAATDGSPEPYARFLYGIRLVKTNGEARLGLGSDGWLLLEGPNAVLQEFASELLQEEEYGHTHLYMSPLSLIIEADSEWGSEPDT